MDFWSRLVGGLGSSAATKQATVNSSEQRLTRCRRLHEQLQIWLKNKKLSTDPIAAQETRNCLESLQHLLRDEIQASAPHLCISHVATSRLYNIVLKIALISKNESVIHEALDFFNILVDSEVGDFLESDSFANALTTFVHNISSTGSILASVHTDGKTVEILFGIATKLRLHPEILPVWFRLQNHDTASALDSSGVLSPSKSGKTEFPLFYFLLDYVHHDGRVGDFARTGLLYIIESAVHTEELEKWVVESDLATLMASGLGALYSRLSRKLVLSFTKESVPAVVAFSEVPQPSPAYDAVEISSTEFQAHLRAFLSYLMFWQDVLEHCTSNDVKQTLLDHFRLLFLQQLLYPSLVESSDMDGGSSVAVLTYLRCILGSINHPDLIRIMLQYLLAIPEPPTDNLFTSRPTTLARRRKSQTLIVNLAKGEEKPSPNLFTLVDLISTSLRSENQQTVTAALRLCSAITSTHHQYAIQTLIRIQSLNDTESRRTLGSHNVEVDILLSMAEEIATEDGLGESYEAHVQDVRNLLETHSCSTRLLALPSSTSVPSKGTHMQASLGSKAVGFHTISTDDPLLKNLVSLLGRFLINDIETNLSLTHALTNLASCGYTRLEGWLLGNSTDDEDPNEKDMSSDDLESSQDADKCSSNASNEIRASKIDGLLLAGRETNRAPSSTSPVFAVLSSLVQQVEALRLKIQDFDIYLAERKHIFKIGEEIDSALSDRPAPVQKSEGPKKSNSVAATPQNQNQIIGSISQRLISESNSSNDVSRSSSPRGRQQSGSSTSATLVGRLGHLRISPSPSPTKRAARNYSSSPFRTKAGAVLSTTPPRRVATPMGPPGVLHQKIKIPPTSLHNQQQHPLSKYHSNHGGPLGGGLSSETSSVRSSDSAGPPTTEAGVLGHAKDGDAREVSLGHVLTNVVILQEFMLELAALVEVRAGLFDEVRFV